MANPDHLEILHQGVEAWNNWRKERQEWELVLHQIHQRKDLSDTFAQKYLLTRPQDCS